MNTYIAITIGPIIKTLGMAKKPRELWSASYLFSYLMKGLIENMPNKVIVLSPAKDIQQELSSVGVYPDRLYLKVSDSSDFRNVETSVQKTVHDISVLLKIDETYLKNYFKIYAVETAADTDSEAVEKLNRFLDACELENFVIGKESKNQPMLELIKMKYRSQLFDIALGKSKFPIDMLSEIASEELQRIAPDQYKKCREKANDEEDDLIKLLKKEFGDELKSLHKYICVVHADGDNIGTLVTKLKDGEHIKLSADLMDFGKKSCTKINDYGGLPIYAGGDDLLFIAPVVSRHLKSKEQLFIFDLIEQINVVFKECLFANEHLKYAITEETSLPSLSFGIAIAYYKYPLYESLELSRNNLFEIAKVHDNKIKNSIAWSFQRHSGSTVTSVLSKTNKELFTAFKQVIAETKSEQLVSAVAHKIKNSGDIFKLFENSDILKTRIHSYFKTYLDYKEEKEKEKPETRDKRLYLEAVMALIFELYKLNPDSKTVIDNCYAILRTAKFIKGLEADHE